MAVQYETLESGLVRAYSDSGFLIHGGSPESDYIEAVDPADQNRKYTETEIPIVDPDKEAQIEDYKQALAELGVDVNEEE